MNNYNSIRKELPEAELLHKIFFYDQETGILTYADRSDDMFLSTRSAKSWRTKYSGQIAGSIVEYDGRKYIQIQLYKEKYVAHRIIWKMHYWKEPPEILDHIDGDGTNNRISNLREATIYQNGWNAKKSSRNKSGYKGVSFNREKNKWRAAIRINKRDILIGYYKSIEDAAQAYQKASAQYHGEFYNPT